MVIGEHGKRLVFLRKRIRKSAKDVVADMEKDGHQITLNQFYELQKGQWPTQRQVESICKFFKITPEYWLFGIEPSPFNNLNKEDRKIVISLIEHLIKNSN